MSSLLNVLARLGLYAKPDVDPVADKEAVTESLVQSRNKVMSELAERSAHFKERSEAIEATTDQRKGDLEDLMVHLQNINDASVRAQNILSRLINRRTTLPLL